MKLKIRSGGTGRDTHVILVLDNGDEIELPGIRALSWELPEVPGYAIARFEARCDMDSDVDLEPPIAQLQVSMTHVCGWVCPDCGSRVPGNGFNGSMTMCDAADCPTKGPRVLSNIPVRAMPQGLVHMDSSIARPERYPTVLAKKLRRDSRIDVSANEAACSMHNAKVLIALACAKADHDFGAGRLDLTGVTPTDDDQFFGIVRYHLDARDGLGPLDVAVGSR